MQCRACMQGDCNEVVDMSSIASKDGQTLYDFFNDCTQLEAYSWDSLPKMLCAQCTQDLQVAYGFKQTARRSDKELKKLVAKRHRIKGEDEALDVIADDAQTDIIVEYINDPLAVLESEQKIGRLETISVPKSAESEVDIKEELSDALIIEASNQSYIESSAHLNNSDDDDDGHKEDEWEYNGETNVPNRRKFICEVCNAQYKRKTSLKDHIFEQHKSSITCTKCSKLYDLPSELQLHENFVHGTESHVQCLWCKERPHRDKLAKHMQQKHNVSYKKYFPWQQKGQHSDGSNNSSNTMQCEKCLQKFLTIDEFAKHVKTRKFNCEFCGNSFKRCGVYASHLKRIHKNSDAYFECTLCLTKFASRRTLCLHMRNEHNTFLENNSSDAEDEKSLYEQLKKADDVKQDVHIADEEEELKNKQSPAGTEDSDKHSGVNEECDAKLFKCYLCEKKFKFKLSYQVHMKYVHKQNIRLIYNNADGERKQQHACDICYKICKSRSSLYLHKKQKHVTEIATKASTATAYSQTRSNEGDDVLLVQQQQQGTDEENESYDMFECRHCHKQIPRSDEKIHIRCHTYKRKGIFLCSFCSREYKTESTLKRHEKSVHMNESSKRKKCPICDKDFNPKYLKTHINYVHTSERKFACDVCGDPFKSYMLLRSHKRLHFERNFPCLLCNKRFIRSYDLTIHMRIHTGEEPFACHLCDRRFNIKVRLNYHLQQHAGIKRKCNICGKEFNHVKQLKIHSYKHTGMPYRCPICNYGCVPRDVFRKHLLRLHNMTMTDEEYRAMFKLNTGRNPNVKTLDELNSEAQKLEQDDVNCGVLNNVYNHN